MMIPPFTLPSNQSIKITLQEATVSDCLDFSDLDPDHEEEVTTLFLNRMQDKASFVDCTTWTGEDRRFALLWYWLHTTDDVEVAITYDCGYCGSTHTYLQDYRKMIEEYASIKGLPERDFDFNGKRITAKPLDGAALEQIETLRMAVTGRRTFKALMNIERIALATGIPRADVDGMTVKAFKELQELTEAALMDMSHGLESDEVDGQISLILPPHTCPNTKEATTRVRVLFRADDWIPAL